jgi:hypothetical protein
MSAGRVEVGDSVFVLVGDAYALQVFPDHQPGLLVIEIFE